MLDNTVSFVHFQWVAVVFLAAVRKKIWSVERSEVVESFLIKAHMVIGNSSLLRIGSLDRRMFKNHPAGGRSRE